MATKHSSNAVHAGVRAEGSRLPARYRLGSFWQTRELKGFYLGLLVALNGLLLIWAPYGFDLEERYGLTWLFWARGVKPAPSEILIVALDRRSAKQSGWPEKPEQWPRELHAKFIQRLSTARARAIVYDLFFSTAHSHSDDASLAKAIRRAGNVILVGHLGIMEDELIARLPQTNLQMTYYPIPVLAEAAAGVAPFPLPNTAHGVTGFWSFKTTAGDIPTLPTLAFQTYALNVYEEFLQLLTRLNPEQAARLPANKKQIITWGGITRLVLHLRELFKTDARIGKQMLAELDQADPRQLAQTTKQTIKALVHLYRGEDWQYLNFYGPPRSITTVTYPEAIRLLAELANNRGTQSIFTGKVILIGMSETSPVEQKDKDIFDTVYSDASGLKMSGVEIAATAVGNLIEDMPVRRLAHLQSFAVIIGWGVFIGVLWRSYAGTFALGISLTLALSYYGLAFYLFNTAGVWVPVVVPLLQLLFGSAVAVTRNRKDLERQVATIRLALNDWLPPNAIDQIVKSPEIARQASGLVYATCLHTDVTGFTAISDSIDPTRLSAMMNDYFITIGQPVTRREGFVSDQTGDAMLAIWAAAQPDIYLRDQACAGALDIGEALVRFHEEREYPMLATRIGLHAGRIAVGGIRIGSTRHYRSFGVIVNTSQRIQSLNKLLRTRVLASRDVVDGLSSLLIRPVGTFALTGITIPLDIFEILGRKPRVPGTASTPDLAWLCAAFTDALDTYQDGQWQSATEQLLEILDDFPEDGPAHFYLRQCEYYKHHPPSGVWSPVIHK